jgi:hypothetical protein
MTASSDSRESPVPFGYKTQWFAVKTSNAQQVASQMELGRLQPAGWTAGLNAAYSDSPVAFITPPVAGWTLVASTVGFPSLIDVDGGDNGFETISRLLRRLSSEFEEAAYFGSHRVVEYFAWALARDGELERAFAFVGESWLWKSVGEITDAEVSLGISEVVISSDGQMEGADGWMPDEETVLTVAEAWNVNPATLDKLGLPPSHGWIAFVARAARI